MSSEMTPKPKKYLITAITIPCSGRDLILHSLQKAIGPRCALVQSSQSTKKQIETAYEQLLRLDVHCVILVRNNHLKIHREKILEKFELMKHWYDLKVITIDFFGDFNLATKEAKLAINVFNNKVRYTGLEGKNPVGSIIIGKVVAEYQRLIKESQEARCFDLVIELDLKRFNYVANLENVLNTLQRCYPDLLPLINPQLGDLLDERYLLFYDLILLKSVPLQRLTIPTSEIDGNEQNTKGLREIENGIESSNSSIHTRARDALPGGPSTSHRTSAQSHTQSQPLITSKVPKTKNSKPKPKQKESKYIIIPITTQFTGARQLIYLLHLHKILVNSRSIKPVKHQGEFNLYDVKHKLSTCTTLVVDSDFLTRAKRKALLGMLKPLESKYDLKYITLDYVSTSPYALDSLEYLQSCLRFALSNMMHITDEGSKKFDSTLFNSRIFKDVAKYQPLINKSASDKILLENVIPMNFTNARMTGFLQSLVLGVQTKFMDVIDLTNWEKLVEEAIELDHSEQTYCKQTLSKYDFSTNADQMMLNTKTRYLIVPFADSQMKDFESVSPQILSSILPCSIELSQLTNSTKPEKVLDSIKQTPNYVRFIIIDKPPSESIIKSFKEAKDTHLIGLDFFLQSFKNQSSKHEENFVAYIRNIINS